MYQNLISKPRNTSRVNRVYGAIVYFWEHRNKGLKMGKRADSDEYYVLDICDDILKEKGIRQHKFDFLRGDTGRRLAVDAFYPKRSLVIEYREKQHFEDVLFFDKPNKMTSSGVPRNVQRKIYDKRREDILPSKGILVVIIPYFELDAKCNGKLNRNRENDISAIRKILNTIE